MMRSSWAIDYVLVQLGGYSRANFATFHEDRGTFAADLFKLATRRGDEVMSIAAAVQCLIIYRPTAVMKIEGSLKKASLLDMDVEIPHIPIANKVAILSLFLDSMQRISRATINDIKTVFQLVKPMNQRFHHLHITSDEVWFYTAAVLHSEMEARSDDQQFIGKTWAVYRVINRIRTRSQRDQVKLMTEVIGEKKEAKRFAWPTLYYVRGSRRSAWRKWKRECSIKASFKKTSKSVSRWFSISDGH